MTSDTSFEELAAEVMSNKDARTAARENAMRRSLAKTLSAYLKAYGMNPGQLAMQAGVPMVHVHRMLHEEVGGPLPLRSIVRAADVFGLEPEVTLTRKVTTDDG